MTLVLLRVDALKLLGVTNLVSLSLVGLLSVWNTIIKSKVIITW